MSLKRLASLGGREAPIFLFLLQRWREREDGIRRFRAAQVREREREALRIISAAADATQPYPTLPLLTRCVLEGGERESGEYYKK